MEPMTREDLCVGCEGSVSIDDAAILHPECYAGVVEDHLGEGHRGCAKLMREVLRTANIKAICAWCCAAILDEDGAKEHAATCPMHPAVLRAEAAEKENAALQAAGDALVDYTEHGPDCIRSKWSSGRPKNGGGYESCYAGKWYQSLPVDETPACTCGMSEALAAWTKLKEAKL